MASINELMEGKTPGEIKICHPAMGKEEWFIPFFQEKIGPKYWIGIGNNGGAKTYLADGEWYLYGYFADLMQRKMCDGNIFKKLDMIIFHLEQLIYSINNIKNS